MNEIFNIEELMKKNTMDKIIKLCIYFLNHNLLKIISNLDVVENLDILDIVEENKRKILDLLFETNKNIGVLELREYWETEDKKEVRDYLFKKFGLKYEKYILYEIKDEENIILKNINEKFKIVSTIFPNLFLIEKENKNNVAIFENGEFKILFEEWQKEIISFKYWQKEKRDISFINLEEYIMGFLIFDGNEKRFFLLNNKKVEEFKKFKKLSKFEELIDVSDNKKNFLIKNRKNSKFYLWTNTEEIEIKMESFLKREGFFYFFEKKGNKKLIDFNGKEVYKGFSIEGNISNNIILKNSNSKKKIRLEFTQDFIKYKIKEEIYDLEEFVLKKFENKSEIYSKTGIKYKIKDKSIPIKSFKKYFIKGLYGNEDKVGIKFSRILEVPMKNYLCDHIKKTSKYSSGFILFWKEKFLELGQEKAIFKVDIKKNIIESIDIIDIFSLKDIIYRDKDVDARLIMLFKIKYEVSKRKYNTKIISRILYWNIFKNKIKTVREKDIFIENKQDLKEAYRKGLLEKDILYKTIEKELEKIQKN